MIDTHVYGRLLTCQTCGTLIDFVEIPQPTLEPARFVCWHCLPRKRFKRPEPRLA